MLLSDARRGRLFRRDVTWTGSSGGGGTDKGTNSKSRRSRSGGSGPGGDFELAVMGHQSG